MDEEWRACARFPDYEISSLGAVRRCRPGQRQARVGYIMTATVHRGYTVVNLMLDHKASSVRVNRLVTEAFHGPAPSDMHEAAHWDRNKLNNEATNLRWATSKSNAEDKKRHRTIAVGSKNGGAKLTEADVMQIRRLLVSGERRNSLAVLFGVSLSAIKRIKAGTHWKGVQA